MRTLAKWIGIAWAGAGAIMIGSTVYRAVQLHPSDAVYSVAGGTMILGMLLFVFPGLLLAVLAARR